MIRVGKRVVVSLCSGFIAAAGTAWATTDEPGQRFEVRLDALAEPHETPSVFNGSASVARPEGALPEAPEGFVVSVFADGLQHARWLAVAPNGDVFLAESFQGKVTVLRDEDGDGRAEIRDTFADGLSRPHGLLFIEDALLIGDVRGVWRVPYQSGDLKAQGMAPITKPGALGQSGGHWTRNLALSPDGAHLFVAVGSRGNVAEEPEPFASVQRFARDGSKQMTFASGLRNPVGIAFYPGTNDLYVVVNERDGLGDGLVPDYLTRITEGAFFGWPYAYLGANPDPDFGAKKPDMVAQSQTPDLLFESHSAALGLVFYDHDQFPAEYRGDAFVAFHGSWNSAKPTGYKVVRAKFEDGRPVGWYDNFLTGFWTAGDERAEVWGRPVGLAVTQDGSLLVADDVANVVWRVSYQPPAVE